MNVCVMGAKDCYFYQTAIKHITEKPSKYKIKAQYVVPTISQYKKKLEKIQSNNNFENLQGEDLRKFQSSTTSPVIIVTKNKSVVFVGGCSDFLEFDAKI